MPQEPFSRPQAQTCNLRGHLQRCQMPNTENSRKTAEKGAEWVTVKQPKNSRKNSQNTRKTAEKQSKQLFFGCFGCFSGCFTVTHSAPLSGVFRLFSLSGIWHLCRWPWRLQFWTRANGMMGARFLSSPLYEVWHPHRESTTLPSTCTVIKTCLSPKCATLPKGPCRTRSTTL